MILQVSSGARKYANQTLLRYMAQGAVEYAKELTKGTGIPIALHLDHGDTVELCKSCIDFGFSSVMIDGSHHPLREEHRDHQAGRRVRACATTSRSRVSSACSPVSKTTWLPRRAPTPSLTRSKTS